MTIQRFHRIHKTCKSTIHVGTGLPVRWILWVWPSKRWNVSNLNFFFVHKQYKVCGLHVDPLKDDKTTALTFPIIFLLVLRKVMFWNIPKKEGTMKNCQKNPWMCGKKLPPKNLWRWESRWRIFSTPKLGINLMDNKKILEATQRLDCSESEKLGSSDPWLMKASGIKL